MAALPASHSSLITVAIVGDAPLVVHGLTAMLRSYEDLIEVRVVDLDDPLPAPSDITLYDPMRDAPARHLHRLLGDPARGLVVMYSLAPPPAMVADMLDRGCAAFLDKRVAAGDMVDALCSLVLEHDRPRVGSRPHAGWAGKEHGLSRRESEVIALITRGLTNEAISAECDLSVNTVKSYIRSVYRKLGVERRAEAVRWGMEHGLGGLGPRRPARPPVAQSAAG